MNIDSLRRNASFTVVMLAILVTAVALVVATVALLARMNG
jgi:hypothetical protein